MATPAPDVTDLLIAWREGNEAALDALIPAVHQELRRLARYYMADERKEHTLQTTALVNEAYLRLVDSRQVRWKDRTHFFAVSSQVMRRILVDFARSRNYQKEGPAGSPCRSMKTWNWASRRAPILWHWMRPWKRWPLLIPEKPGLSS